MSDEVVRAYLFVLSQQFTGGYVDQFAIANASRNYDWWVRNGGQYEGEQVMNIARTMGYQSSSS